MKNCLIVSFDIIREYEPTISLSIASLMSYAKNDPSYGVDFIIENYSINQFYENKISMDDVYSQILNKNIDKYTHIAFSCFVWNEYLINPLIHQMKKGGYQGKIILGGAQITYCDRNKLKNEYPDADFFISGYGELSLLNIIKEEKDSNIFFHNINPDFTTLPSPYLTNEINIFSRSNIRWETKRGCPFKCSFCAHRNLENGKVNWLNVNKSKDELFLFKKQSVNKINVLDPIFNIGKDYIEILKAIDRLNFNSTKFSFQSKIELLAKSDGKVFLDLVEKTNSHLEFGIQTVIPEEYNIIDRKNDLRIIKEQLQVLKSRNISYEVSIMYGLPNQTFNSFKKTIDFLKSNDCENIKSWPLMLLKGTPLYFDQKKWNLQEEIIGDYQIPLVTSSTTFTKDDWFQMNEISSQLMNSGRLF
jgi:radical SAM superfamily enzyme YgiQ (UPF0313 family)